MPFRLDKSLKRDPGVRLNVSTSGIGSSGSAGKVCCTAVRHPTAEALARRDLERILAENAEYEGIPDRMPETGVRRNRAGRPVSISGLFQRRSWIKGRGCA